MSKVTEVHVGVIGVGFIGEVHTRVLADMPGVEVTGVADPNEAVAKQVAERYSIPGLYTDPKDLLLEVDAVVIASPEFAHADNVVAALDAGKHVFLEKPMADTVEGGRMIVEATKRASGKLLMGYILRHDPRYVQGRVCAKKIGEISAMYARRRGVIDVPARVAKWSHPIFYMGVHDIDMLRWYSGDEVEQVYAASSSKVVGGGAPDSTMAILKFRRGAIATLEVTWILPREFNAALESAIDVFGEKGMVRVESLDQGVQACIQGSGYEFPDVMHWPEIYGRIEGDARRQMDHFIRIIRTDEEPLVTAEDGYESLLVALAIIKSIESGEPVDVVSI